MPMDDGPDDPPDVIVVDYDGPMPPMVVRLIVLLLAPPTALTAAWAIVDPFSATVAVPATWMSVSAAMAVGLVFRLRAAERITTGWSIFILISGVFLTLLCFGVFMMAYGWLMLDCTADRDLMRWCDR